MDGGRAGSSVTGARLVTSATRPAPAAAGRRRVPTSARVAHRLPLPARALGGCHHLARLAAGDEVTAEREPRPRAQAVRTDQTLDGLDLGAALVKRASATTSFGRGTRGALRRAGVTAPPRRGRHQPRRPRWARRGAALTAPSRPGEGLVAAAVAVLAQPRAAGDAPGTKQDDGAVVGHEDVGHVGPARRLARRRLILGTVAKSRDDDESDKLEDWTVQTRMRPACLRVAWSEQTAEQDRWRRRISAAPSAR